MTMERLVLTGRRILAWWIDAFAVGAVVIVLRWIINAITAHTGALTTAPADGLLNGTVQTTYETIAWAVIFYAYRVIIEGRYRTSLGKWSLGLEVVSPYPSYQVAAVRNSWLLLTLVGIWVYPWQDIIPIVVGATMFIWGQHVFDKLAGAIVPEKMR